jgi:hypothetical protein
VHFSKKEIELYADGDLNDLNKYDKIAKHLEECEFCREYYDNYRLYAVSLKEAEAELLPSDSINLAEKLHREALRSKIIDLLPMTEQTYYTSYLAADGEPAKEPALTSLATFYSENPELVLRVMHDNETNRDYLQLVGEDAELVSHALIQIPEIDFDYVTDETGRVELAQPLTGDFARLKWQVKMPEAVFDLEPLEYDPDKTEYRKEMVLETEHNDKIRVTFEGKTEGKQISIRILELDGRDDFESVKVLISQNDLAVIKTTGPSVPVSFTLPDLKTSIKIRLYQ